MALSEFELIRRFFDRPQAASGRDDVVLGIGDDAAVVTVPEDCDLVLCMDTLVAGVHFPQATSPEAIGHKALAVNLSDLAAMGAEGISVQSNDAEDEFFQSLHPMAWSFPQDFLDSSDPDEDTDLTAGCQREKKLLH